MDFVFPVPDYPPLVGFRFYAQHFAFDGGAPRGVAMSNAVCVFLGE